MTTGNAHELGQFIKRRREALGYSQKTMAEALGKEPDAGQKWLSGIENRPAGRGLPSGEDLEAIAGFLGVPLEDLLRLGGYPVGVPRAAEEPVVYTAIDLERDVSRTNDLSDDAKGMIQSTIRFARDQERRRRE